MVENNNKFKKANLSSVAIKSSLAAEMNNNFSTGRISLKRRKSNNKPIKIVTTSIYFKPALLSKIQIKRNHRDLVRTDRLIFSRLILITGKIRKI